MNCCIFIYINGTSPSVSSVGVSKGGGGVSGNRLGRNCPPILSRRYSESGATLSARLVLRALSACPPEQDAFLFLFCCNFSAVWDKLSTWRTTCLPESVGLMVCAASPLFWTYCPIELGSKACRSVRSVCAYMASKREPTLALLVRGTYGSLSPCLTCTDMHVCDNYVAFFFSFFVFCVAVSRADRRGWFGGEQHGGESGTHEALQRSTQVQVCDPDRHRRRSPQEIHRGHGFHVHVLS